VVGEIGAVRASHGARRHRAREGGTLVKLVIALCALAGAAGAAPQDLARGTGGLPHEELARALVRELGAGVGSGEAPALRTLVNERFVRVPLGAFELL
jgi:hypothetical protein